MSISFKHHDTLRLFNEVAQHSSFSDAAESLNMTKGAISYQIKSLEENLALKLFERYSRGVELTPNGRRLLNASLSHYREVETELARLRGTVDQSLTVGMSSYFASRWLSPRLMTFMQKHPDIQLRIQPMTQVFDLERQGVDLAIRWGDGDWDDVEVEPFLPMPSWPVGNQDAADCVQQLGLERAFSQFTLLRDRDDSNAWTDWFRAAGLTHQTRKDTLIIPDPNVRVQAVIDGQGIALNDELVNRELEKGRLVRLSETELSSFGYFLAKPHKQSRTETVDAFVHWLHEQ